MGIEHLAAPHLSGSAARPDAQEPAVAPVQELKFDGYLFDAATRCWLPLGDRPEFSYTDGDEVERRIHSTLLAARDLSAASAELSAQIVDWPTRYHFSPCRANLLRPFTEILRGRVLEIGAGCGAITRFLAECGGELIAVEGSPMRAASAAARCRDLKNVNVVVDAFHRLPASPTFDVVTLVGVLEYARMYFPSAGEEPVDAMIRHARRFLKPSGTLILAIENQLGVKYFAGVGEDHVGLPMFGIEDRYQSSGVVTFGRGELREKLARAGLIAQSWWYPFPDYKLPTLVVAEDGLAATTAQRLQGIIRPAFEADPQLPASPLFMLERAWKPIARNGLGPDLANSFLVLARSSDTSTLVEGLADAYHFAVERKPEYAKAVAFSTSRTGLIAVRQERLFPQQRAADGVPLHLNLDSQTDFVDGELWSQRLKDLLTTDGWCLADLVVWARRWYGTLQRVADPERISPFVSAGQLLPGSLLDAVPRNMMVTADGSEVFIDQEWSFELPLELGFVAFRGIYLSLLGVGKVVQPLPSTPLRAATLFLEVVRSLGLWIVEADLARYADLESDIQRWVSGRSRVRIEDVLSFRLDVRTPLDVQRRSEEKLREVRQSLVDRDEQVRALHENVAERDAVTLDLHAKIQEVSTWGQSLAAQVKERDGQIRVLQENLAERDIVIVDLQAKIQEVSVWGQSLAERLSERDDLLRWAQDASTERDSLVIALQARIRDVDGCGLALAERLREHDELLRKTLAGNAALDSLVVALDKRIADICAWGQSLAEEIRQREGRWLTESERAIGSESLVAKLNESLLQVNARAHVLADELRQREERIRTLQTNELAHDALVRALTDRISALTDSINECEARAASLGEQNRTLRAWQASADRLALEQETKIRALVEQNSEVGQQLEQSLAQNRNLRLAAEVRSLEMTRVSDWARQISDRPASYAVRRHAYLLSRQLLRMLPISIARKQRLRDSFLAGTRRIRTLLGSPAVASQAPAPTPHALFKDLTEQAGERDVFVFSIIDWHFRIQRPQHLARSFARCGRRVFYFTNHFVDSAEAGYEIEMIEADLPLYQIKLHVRSAPAIYFAPPTAEAGEMIKQGIAKVIEDFGATSTISLVQHGYWFPMVQCLPNSYRIYDCMDHHEGFGSVPQELIEIEKRMLARSDMVVVTSSWLERHAREYNDKVCIVRNAGEYRHFSTPPATKFVDQGGRKIAGYYGAIADWFDVDLIRRLAERNRETLILLVGNDTVSAADSLADLPNVLFTGEIPYDKLPYYVHAFDVCLLPFKVIPLTMATNPVKVYEYLAAGKPVVCVDLPEIAQFGDLVVRASDAEDYVDKVSLQLASRDSPHRVAARQRFAADQTWEHRVEDLAATLRGLELPKISVIVLTYNNLDLTVACLASIVERSDYANLELIIVDNASTDGTPAYLQEFAAQHPFTKVILNDRNLGFAAGNNVGLAAATGDYLVLLNNDTIVTRGWALTLLRHLQEDSGIGLVGPLTNNIGNEARVEMAYKDPADMPAEALRLTLARMGQTYPLRCAAFFCAMMPRSTLLRCGPISEDYGRGFFEDDDYCHRIEACGLRIVCADDVFIHHHLSASFNKLANTERQALFERNKAIYERKWGTWTPHCYRY